MPRGLVNLDNVYQNNLGTFSKIIEVVLPVFYPEKFYNELFDAKDKSKQVFFSKMAYYGEIAVGALKAKLLPSKSGGVAALGVYIEVLAVLDPYREKGIGSQLLQYIEDECKEHFQHNIYVHVAANNEDSLKWYQKRGFEIEGEILKGYYKETDGSTDAYVLKKHF
ncbi:LAFE_0G08152g1_1 [Lachancea fermentati]|uniref:LAFE_0G08152g1_1 n=1 Tax=Lachancea fermentati TaxID=4955 RepID=A0A1G4MHU4_LACFM|nr:LAFE_0G08152g1_1 [Lachancea fermentati]